jgi:hypothetical protein
VRAAARNPSRVEPYEYHVGAVLRAKTEEQQNEEDLGYDVEEVTDVK